ncbi:MAG: ornithine cyclodeaminase family protein [Bacillota bacterium]
MLVLSREDVRSSITMEMAIEQAKKAYIEYSAGEAVVPVRTQIPMAAEKGIVLFMPGYSPGIGAVGLKAVSVFPGNAALGLATINALVCLVDTETGYPLAVMEGGYLTALRTGAASGVATQFLARGDVAVLAIIGSGVQARTQLEAVCQVRSITKVLVFDLSLDRAALFVQEMAANFPHLDFEITATSDEAVQQADVVVCTTTSKKPVFSGKAVRPGTHINGVGSFTPQMQEVGADVVVAAAKIVVDSREAIWEEAGDLIIPRNQGLISEKDIYAEIGEIASGQKAGREKPDEITFFKTVGMALQDVTVAKLVYQRAKELGRGTSIQL